jgi:hypothetical protein
VNIKTSFRGNGTERIPLKRTMHHFLPQFSGKVITCPILAISFDYLKVMAESSRETQIFFLKKYCGWLYGICKIISSDG